MQLALVVGTAVSTVKHASMTGWKLLVVQPLSADGRSPDGDPLLAVDDLNAGRGDTVLLTSDGEQTRNLMASDDTPVRYSSIGICDR